MAQFSVVVHAAGKFGLAVRGGRMGLKSSSGDR